MFGFLFKRKPKIQEISTEPPAESKPLTYEEILSKALADGDIQEPVYTWLKLFKNDPERFIVKASRVREKEKNLNHYWAYKAVVVDTKEQLSWSIGECYFRPADGWAGDGWYFPSTESNKDISFLRDKELDFLADAVKEHVMRRWYKAKERKQRKRQAEADKVRNRLKEIYCKQELPQRNPEGEPCYCAL